MKYILIFNGYPQSGKTTFQNMIANRHSSIIYSSIKPIVDFTDNMICNCGYKNLETLYNKEKSKKSDVYRRFLSNAKKMLYEVDNGNFINKIILDKVYNFVDDKDCEFFMIDIREPKHIKSFTDSVLSDINLVNKLMVKTVFVEGSNERLYFNTSDDNVEKYSYDYKIKNLYSLEELEMYALPKFLELLKENWEKNKND